MAIYKYALFGEHISQSRSPEIHQHFAQQFNIDLAYTKITVTAESFVSAWHEFVAAGGQGANITMPCKRLAYEICTAHSEIAKLTRSVNTIQVQSATQWYGDSTDGVGLIRDIVDYYGHSLTGRRILLLGAGGAAAGIVPALLHEQPSEVVIANRTLANAQQLALSFIQASDFANIPSIAFDYIINAAADLPLDQLNVKLNSNAVAYDLRYTPNAQIFLQWAKDRGARFVHDGYGMLLEQAAASFKIWFGVQPSTEILRAR
ncbi:MAG: shikimate dehydrogenase [Gammaproteobacteria bacterium]